MFTSTPVAQSWEMSFLRTTGFPNGMSTSQVSSHFVPFAAQLIEAPISPAKSARS
jgi:hypothetical protein